jgi:hypothetical protein
MPLVVADRVRETTTTTGTGTITLAGAITGYQSFSVIGNANTTYYTINAGNQWEVGIGTYLGAGPTLSRDTVLKSSNSGSLVDFAAGAKDVFLAYPAEKSVYQDGAAIAAGSAVLPIANGGTNATTAANALTSLGAYPAANPSGFTSNTGTVTSVSGTGTVSGLTLTGSITTSGSLTLGGTLALTSGDVTTALGFTPYNATNPSGYLSTVNLATNVTGTLPVGNGGTGAATLTANNVLLGNGTSALQAVAPGAAGNVLSSNGTTWVSSTPASGVSLSANNTWTGTQTFAGTTSVLGSVFTDVAEVATVSATAATGTINYDVSTQSVLYYTSNASANWTLNLRFSSGTSLNTAMSTGQAVTVVHLVTQGATAYYNSVVTVDGAANTPKWQGGAAPTAGNASSIDVYTYTIVKTGSAAFTVFASQTQFK